MRKVKNLGLIEDYSTKASEGHALSFQSLSSNTWCSYINIIHLLKFSGILSGSKSIISSSVEKRFTVRSAHSWSIFSALEEEFLCVAMQCHLYIYRYRRNQMADKL